MSDDLRVSALSQSTPTPFEIAPEAEERAALADALGILGVRKLRFSGEVKVQGKRDWLLTGNLGATVVQACVVTLDPVTTRIDVPVRRLYMANWVEPEGDEVEMPEDDENEPLRDVISPRAVMAEALALALPLYPRTDGAETAEAVFAEDGTEPLRDEDTKPFAALSGLREKMQKGS
ncbi:YceD family protein [Lutimaribacter marinistellae]|uniref:YceD family protein n=1 Tax=Lutimaribacter marinistellae TaxID=1820329 RepID=A0ABV7TLH9_9RHOB